MKPLPERERGVIWSLNEETGRGTIVSPSLGIMEIPFDVSAIQYDNPVVGDHVSFIRKGYYDPSAINVLLVERAPKTPKG